MLFSSALMIILYLVFRYVLAWIRYFNSLDSRLGQSTWRWSYDYPVIGERDISDLDDKTFVRLRRKRNRVITLMYSILLIMFLLSMSLLSEFLIFFLAQFLSCFLFFKYKKKAIEQLYELNGKTHKLVSAFSICYDNQVVYSYVEEVKLKMRKLSKKSIKDYVEIDLPTSSCGSYRFEANGKYLFSDVVGNTSTILGLPILPLIKILFKKKIITYV